MTRAKEIVGEALGPDARFMIVELAAGGLKPVYDHAGELLKFEDGRDAAKKAQALSEVGRKFQVRAIGTDDWRSREERRFDTEYTQLPWQTERWWQGLRPTWGEHFPHVSIIKDVMLAFTESDDKGAADIQTRIKPGRYLERYFGSVLNGHVIRDLCTQFSAKFEDNMLLFADDEDTIEEVYITGPSSCMSKGVGEYASPVHPCRVYAGGDLQVAFLRRDGRIVARAVVWPEKKIYNTVYGDTGRLVPLLTKKGFKLSPPYGARLKRVEHRDRGKKTFCLVVPHLDGVGWVFDRGGHLEVGKSSSMPIEGIGCGGARGLTEALAPCGHCDKGAGPARSMREVFTTNDSNTQRWCGGCVKDHSFECRVSGYTVANELGVEAKPGRVWKRYLAKTFICDATGERWGNGYQTVLKTGEKWNRTYAKEHAKQCSGCGHWVRNDNPCGEACKERAAAKKKAAATAQQGVGTG